MRTIPLERIRGVDVSTPPLHRLLGIAVLRIDTGASGDEKQEGELDGVTVEEAERLKAVLLWHARARTARRAQARRPLARPGSGPPAATDASGAPAASGAQPGAAAARRSATRSARRLPSGCSSCCRASGSPYGPLSGAYLLTPFALAGRCRRPGVPVGQRVQARRAGRDERGGVALETPRSSLSAP